MSALPKDDAVVDELTREDLTTIAKSLHRTRKDLERSRRNAEKREIPGLVSGLEERMVNIEQLILRVDALAEDLAQRKRALANRRRRQRAKEAEQAKRREGKDAVALKVYELKVVAERTRQVVAIDGYEMEDDVLKDMRRVRNVVSGAIRDHVITVAGLGGEVGETEEDE